MLDALNLADHLVKRCGHEGVHRHGIVALDEIGCVAIAAEERVQFVMGNARQHRGAGDLVAVQVQDGQHGAVVDRVEEFVRVPARGMRAGLRFAIADHAGDQQIGIVKGRAKGMRERIAQLASLMNRTWRLRCYMARDAAGKGELLEITTTCPRRSSALVRIDPSRTCPRDTGCEHARCAVARVRRRRPHRCCAGG